MAIASHNILIVEDNSTIREVLKTALEMEGFLVQEAGDGLEALSVLGHLPRPDVILLDIFMPRMDGYQFLEEIKKDPTQPIAGIPVLVISAVANAAMERLPQVQGVFSKPISFDKLFEAIHLSMINQR
jgi:CheY-like chemotaxis protein